MRILRSAAITTASAAVLAVVGAATAWAAPFGSLGEGPDLTIAPATGEGTNGCSVLITNEGDGDARDVTLHAPLQYSAQSLGTLAPGESTTATQFDCGIFPTIFYFVTAEGELNLSNNFLIVSV